MNHPTVEQLDSVVDVLESLDDFSVEEMVGDMGSEDLENAFQGSQVTAQELLASSQVQAAVLKILARLIKIGRGEIV